MIRSLSIASFILAVAVNCCSWAADEPANTDAKPEQPADATTKTPDVKDDAKLVPLNKQRTVFIDRAGKKLILKGQVVLREGLLEMFICKTKTKEHEAILSIDSDAFVIHTGLLALGAKTGGPAQFQEEYKPPTGQKINIFVSWIDAEGKTQRMNSQKWIRNAISRYHGQPLAELPAYVKIPEDSQLRYDKDNQELHWIAPITEAQPDELLNHTKDEAYQKGIKGFFTATRSKELQADWVFVGSSFYEEENGEKYYQAEAGNIICVANFNDAMIDVAQKSSADNDGLNFEPYTERIPPLGTRVTIELIPVLEEKETKEKAEKSTEPEQAQPEK